jgi:hypothetical protein
MASTADLMRGWQPWSKRVHAVLRTLPLVAPQRDDMLEARVRKESAMREADMTRRSNQVELWRIWPPHR